MATYESYKDSGVKWLGQIPSHWEVKRAKTIFVRHKRPVRKEDEIVTCFRDGQVTLRKNRRIEGFTNAAKEFGYQGIRKGDLVIHEMDAFAGAVGVSDSDGKSTPVYSVCTTRIPENSEKYYAHIIKVMANLGFIQSLSKGIRERSTAFSYDIFGPQLLPIPPTEEQEAIVAYLDKVTGEIDRAIEAQQKMIDALNERKQIIITRAVTRGLDPDVPLLDSGIDWLGQIPAHWELKKLKAIADIKGRIGFRGYTNSDLVERGEGAITLSPSNIINGKMSYHKCSYLSWHKYYESPEIMVENGHILFVKTGSSYGKTTFVTDLPMEATINPQFSLIKPKGVDSYFLNFAISSQYFKLQVERGVIGSTIPTISQSAIGSMLALMPPHDEQLEISRHLNSLFIDLDSLIANCERMISLLQERKQIIINEVVTGKKKVI